MQPAFFVSFQLDRKFKTDNQDSVVLVDFYLHLCSCWYFEGASVRFAGGLEKRATTLLCFVLLSFILLRVNGVTVIFRVKAKTSNAKLFFWVNFIQVE